MNKVLNNSIGSPYDLDYPQLAQEDEKQILASLFEQLLIFDKITIASGRLNFPLMFLIKHLGINKVEELLDKKIIDFFIWSPLLFTGTGRDLPDGTRDTSVIYGQPPIIGASLSDDDLNPEVHIDRALSYFDLHRDRKRIFKRIAVNKYTVPEGLQSASDSTKIVIDAYASNNLSDVGLPFEKDPTHLDLKERNLLLTLGHKVLETALLSKYGLKSLDNYSGYKICESNLKNIGKAYEVTKNTSNIFKIESVPDLKRLYLENNFDFDDALKLRYKSNAKYFRKWVNNISDNENSLDITKEYLNEIKGPGFFDSPAGKLLKNIGVFGLSTALGGVIAGTGGVAAGFGLGLLDTFWLESILKGKNPSMFLSEVELEIKKKTQ